PLRSKTRKRSSMVEVAAAARLAAAGLVPSLLDEEEEAAASRPITTTLAGAPARYWGLWLVLPMIGAGLAIAAMSMRLDPVVDAERPAPVAAPASEPRPPEASSVRWHFDTTPPGATVSIGGKPWPGTTPTLVEVPRGDDPLPIVLNKHGYSPIELTLAPIQNQNYAYQLAPVPTAEDEVKVARPRGKRPRPPDDAAAVSTPPESTEPQKPKFRDSPFPGKSSDRR
ncbi:MAG: PEGA domain-containing protein, partial [Chloroflexi bacterium]|nr:PEGA domain-containing protein [Chloroflexota bacterium]